MTIALDCRGKEVLRIKNLLFGLLYTSIMDVIEEKNIELTSSLQNMLYKMDQDIFGGGAIYVDIAHYLKTKRDVIIFANLLMDAIERKNHTAYPFQENIKKIFFDFNKAILDYAQELPN